MEMLPPKHQSQCPLLNLSLVELTGYECHGHISSSDRSGKMCEIIAPRPYAETPAANFNDKDHNGKVPLLRV